MVLEEKIPGSRSATSEASARLDCAKRAVAKLTRRTTTSFLPKALPPPKTAGDGSLGRRAPRQGHKVTRPRLLRFAAREADIVGFDSGPDTASWSFDGCVARPRLRMRRPVRAPPSCTSTQTSGVWGDRVTSL